MRMDKLTSRFTQALQDAQSLAVGRDHNVIEPVHLLVALLDQQRGARSRIAHHRRGIVLIERVRQFAGERLEAEYARRIDIAARIHVGAVATGLLRAHAVQGADHGTGRGGGGYRLRRGARGVGQLQRHLPLRVLLLGHEHRAHAALAEQMQQAEAGSGGVALLDQPCRGRGGRKPWRRFSHA